MNSLADRLWLVRHAPARRSTDRRSTAPGSTARGSTARAVIVGAVLAWVVAWVVASPVLAHADLVTADPADGAVLTVAPTTITLTFSEALDTARSSLALISEDGTVATGNVSGDGRAMTLGPLVQDGRSLGPGGYEIRWTSVAADGDVLRGRLTFTVSEPTPMPATPEPSTVATEEPALTPAATSTSAPTPAPTRAPDDATPVVTSTADALIPIVAGLVSVAVIGALVLRRSRRA